MKCSKMFAFQVARFLSMGSSALVSIGSGTDGDTVRRSNATAACEGSGVLSVAWSSESTACSGESRTSSDTDDVPYV